MNRKKYKYENINRNNDIPSIVVETASTDNIPFADSTIQLNGTEKNGTEKSETEKIGTDKEDNVEEKPVRRKSLRRNSISLPNLGDFEQVENKSDLEKNNQISEEEITEDEEIQTFRPLRNARRKSVINPRMLRPPEDDESGNNSPANSITSVNSLASLFREKMQSLPQTFRKKTTPDYKTRIFVILLFTAILVLIVTAYFLYHQKVLQRAYFEKIKFNKVSKFMKIYNNESIEIIHARLGTTLNYDKVHPCLPMDQRNDGSICLEWMYNARLYLNFYMLHETVKCYNLKWISLSENTHPTDCIDLSHGGHWYGGGQTSENAWPLEKGDHYFSPFVTGRVDKHEWGNVLKRYFISSRGAAIIIDNDSPLYVSISGETKKELCLKAKHDNFAYVNRFTTTPQLNYSICTGTNMSELHSKLTESTLWDGLKKEDVDIIHSLITEPLWEITSDNKEEFTEETIFNYTEHVLGLRSLKQGHVLINEFWQNHIGDFEVDTNRFPTLDNQIEILRRRGFRVVFAIQPYISTESSNFADAVKKRLLVSERFSDRRIPALTRYKTLQSAGVLDITNNRSVPWLLDKLKKVMNQYKFNAFYLDLGIAYNMPHYYQCEKALLNPDKYKTLFINSMQNGISLFGVNSAIERPKPPSFVFLPQFESSWDGLRRVIPTILTYGILGYPFLIPGAVGGDYEAPGVVHYSNSTDELLPDQELYMRWLQLSAFLPVVRYNHLPSMYGDNTVLEMAKHYASFRTNLVTPILKKLARVALNNGMPLIRPLWMLDSSDPACHTVVDEFSIGDDLIVAPILYSGMRQREVYLPAGVWRDGIDKSLRKGSRWIHDYRIEEDKIAYFEKMPDDTRF